MSGKTWLNTSKAILYLPIPILLAIVVYASLNHQVTVTAQPIFWISLISTALASQAETFLFFVTVLTGLWDATFSKSCPWFDESGGRRWRYTIVENYVLPSLLCINFGELDVAAIPITVPHFTHSGLIYY